MLIGILGIEPKITLSKVPDRKNQGCRHSRAKSDTSKTRSQKECEKNPNCRWADGRCLCTGARGDNAGELLGRKA